MKWQNITDLRMIKPLIWFELSNEKECCYI